MIDFLLGVPGKLKTLMDRLNTTWAAKVDTLHDTRLTSARAGYLDRLDATISSRNFGTRCAILTASSGNWTVPEDVSCVEYWMIGAGGGGGGGGRGTYNAGGGGGGGGEIGFGRLPVTPGGAVAYSIGDGGTGGAGISSPSAGFPGSAGGATTFGDITVMGGGGGVGGNAGSNEVSGGPGGGSPAPNAPSAVQAGRAYLIGAKGTISPAPAQSGLSYGQTYDDGLSSTGLSFTQFSGTAFANPTPVGIAIGAHLGQFMPSSTGGAGGNSNTGVAGLGGRAANGQRATSGDSKGGGGGGGGYAVGGAGAGGAGGSGAAAAANSGGGGGGGGGVASGTSGGGGNGGSGIILVFYASRL